MSPDRKNHLFRTYPLLFPTRKPSVRKNPYIQTERGLGISCMDGWFPILDALCEQLYLDYHTAHKYLQDVEALLERRMNGLAEDVWAKSETTENLMAEVKSARERLAREEVKLPQFLQIKETWGMLDILLDGSPEQMAMVTVVTAISKRLCEDCGSNAYSVPPDYADTLCPMHIQMQYGKDFLNRMLEQLAADDIAAEFLPLLRRV